MTRGARPDLKITGYPVIVLADTPRSKIGTQNGHIQGSERPYRRSPLSDMHDDSPADTTENSLLAFRCSQVATIGALHPKGAGTVTVALLIDVEI